jgi:hypothetical protein
MNKTPLGIRIFGAASGFSYCDGYPLLEGVAYQRA